MKYVLDFSKIDGLLYSFVPFAIMGLSNIVIIYKFVRAKMASKHDGTESTNQALSSVARNCGMTKSSEPIKWQDSNTPILTPYKAFSGALLL